MNLRTVIAVAVLLAGAGAPAFAASEGEALYTAMKGTFRNSAGGTCQTPFYKSGEPTKSVRGEEAMGATVTNAGTTIDGQLIMRGARIGQMVSPMTEKTIRTARCISSPWASRRSPGESSSWSAALDLIAGLGGASREAPPAPVSGSAYTPI
jgi:hypothetical protein